MGDIVNLSARLMGTAARVAKEENIQGGYVLVDEATVLGCLTEQNLSFNLKARYKMKGTYVIKSTHQLIMLNRQRGIDPSVYPKTHTRCRTGTSRGRP